MCFCDRPRTVSCRQVGGERRAREHRDFVLLPLGDEPIGDVALLEQFYRAREQAARARALELLALAPLDNRDVDAREGELPGQHHARRTTAGNQHRMLRHARDLAARPGPSGKPPGQV